MLRFVALAVLCSFVTSSPAERQKRQALVPAVITNNCVDAFKNVPNPCTDNPAQKVYFPHPTDSSKFIQCDRYGRMYIIQCPENLLYSAATGTCRSVTTNPPVTNPPVVVTNVPVTQSPVVVNPNNPCTQQALSKGQIYFAVSGDNTKFIECDMLGHANVLPCPTGLVWSEQQLACVYPFNTGAGGSGTGTGTGTGGTGTGTSTGTGGTGTGTGTGTGLPTNFKNPCTAANIAAKKLFFAHPDNTKFFQCDLWGDVFVVSCPAGLIWNQYSETCASAYIQVSSGGAVATGK